MTGLTYATLEERIASWAARQPSVQAIVVVGSRARPEPPADAWADLDLILFAGAPGLYEGDFARLSEISPVWVPVLNHTGQGDPEWLVVFEGGLKVDFVLAAVPAVMANPSAEQLMAASPYQAVLRRGARVLFDRSGAPLITVAPAAPPPIPHPPQAQFTAAIHHFLLQATRVARFLRRGDLWRAYQLGNCDLKQRLLAMMEWQARAHHGPEYDTWHDGRFLEARADEETLKQLPAAFGGYDTTALWLALMATVNLYAKLARQTAADLALVYAAAAETQVTGWLRTVRPE